MKKIKYTQITASGTSGVHNKGDGISMYIDGYLLIADNADEELVVYDNAFELRVVVHDGAVTVNADGVDAVSVDGDTISAEIARLRIVMRSLEDEEGAWRVEFATQNSTLAMTLEPEEGE